MCYDAMTGYDDMSSPFRTGALPTLPRRGPNMGPRQGTSLPYRGPNCRDQVTEPGLVPPTTTPPTIPQRGGSRKGEGEAADDTAEGGVKERGRRGRRR
jgi:hypothetical protein